MTNKQPEALVLADLLDTVIFERPTEDELAKDAAAELRRLHEVNAELVEALNKIKAHMDTDEYAWEVAVAALIKSQGENHGA